MFALISESNFAVTMSLLRPFSSVSALRGALAFCSKYSKTITQVRLMSAKSEETDAEFDARYEAYFNRPDIDGWEVSMN